MWRPPWRFTVRSAMIAVALVAVGIVFLLPVGQRLAWLWRTPGSVNLFAAGVVAHQVLPTRVQVGSGPFVKFPAGQPVAAVCTYDVSALPILEPGVPYRLTVGADLLDMSRTPWVPLESTYERFWLVSGSGAWGERRGTFAGRLTPRSKGEHAVQYWVRVADLYGRSARVALHTGGFQAE
ncbi:MAG: hypothetical protein U0835_04110 [Isosphaeraceae bacterium]